MSPWQGYGSLDRYKRSESISELNCFLVITSVHGFIKSAWLIQPELAITSASAVKFIQLVLSYI